MLLNQDGEAELSQAPDKDTSDTVLLAMGRFPFLIANPPSPDDMPVILSGDFPNIGSNSDSGDASEVTIRR